MPVETGEASVKAFSGLWQLAHETDLSDESRVSKYSSQPSSRFSGVYSFSSGQMISGKPSGGAGGSAPWPACMAPRAADRATSKPKLNKANLAVRINDVLEKSSLCCQNPAVECRTLNLEPIWFKAQRSVDAKSL